MAAVVDDLDDRQLAREQTKDREVLFGELALAFLELLGVDGEQRVERRQLLHEPTPLVDPAHALHEDALRALGDDLVTVDRLELDVEVTVALAEQAIDRRLALEPTHLRIDDGTIAEPERRFTELGGQRDRAALARDLDGLNEVDHRHVGELTAELRASCVLLLEALVLLALQQHRHSRRDLFDVDRLGEVVLDTELQPADLVLDRLLAGEKDERDQLPTRVVLDLHAQVEAIATGQSRIRDDEVGLGVLEKLESFFRRLRWSDREPGFAQADLQHSSVSSVAIDDEEILPRHAFRPGGPLPN